MLITKSHKTIQFIYLSINSNIIYTRNNLMLLYKRNEYINYLGITTDVKLTWKNHVDKIRKKIFQGI